MTSWAQIQTRWVTTLVAALADSGVTDVVVSPGSRSTPIVWAAHHLGLTCHVIVDERSAAFFALGRARLTGTPAMLVCTSGSAGAHYLPAVVEADAGFAPLLVVTANRPPELHGCAAPQTIDQSDLYGRRVRFAADVGTPSDDEAALRALARRAAQAVAASLAPSPGPVHLDVPLRKPLEPDPTAAQPACAPPRAPAPRQLADDAALDQVAAAIAASERGVIAAGPARAGAAWRDAAYRLATAAGYPLLAEASSQLRFAGDAAPAALCDAFDVALASPAARRALAPDVIVELGAPPTSRAWADYLAAHAGVPRFVLAEHGWPDPSSTATAIVRGDLGHTLARLADRAEAGAGRDGGAWLARFADADRRAAAAIEAEVGDGCSEGAAMAAIAAALPDGAVLSLGNSLPIRTVDTFCRGRAARVAVLSQRGANGIDGLISAAAGAASAGDRPVVLVLGDVSFQHDVGGLAAAAAARAPLAIVVIDNAGGRIFEQLPLAGVALPDGAFERFWLTPPACAPIAAAAAFGVRAVRADGAAEVSCALGAALARPGCTVVHVPVPPSSATAARRRILAALETDKGAAP